MTKLKATKTAAITSIAIEELDMRNPPLSCQNQGALICSEHCWGVEFLSGGMLNFRVGNRLQLACCRAGRPAPPVPDSRQLSGYLNLDALSTETTSSQVAHGTSRMVPGANPKHTKIDRLDQASPGADLACWRPNCLARRPVAHYLHFFECVE